MPFVQVSTNLSNEAVPKDFEKRFSVFLAEAMDKPIEVCLNSLGRGRRKYHCNFFYCKLKFRISISLHVSVK
jgi:hypothetical protein